MFVRRENDEVPVSCSSSTFKHVGDLKSHLARNSLSISLSQARVYVKRESNGNLFWRDQVCWSVNTGTVVRVVCHG